MGPLVRPSLSGGLPFCATPSQPIMAGMNQNIYIAFEKAWAGREDRPFLLLPEGETLSYALVKEMAARFAALLREQQVKPGDRVMAQVGKSPAAVALYLGTLQVGAVYVPLNTAYTAAEVDYFVSNARPVVLVSDPASAEALQEVCRQRSVASHISLASSSWQQMPPALLEVEPDWSVCQRSSDDLAAFLYTSGTTGRSKGAMLSHGNLLSNAHSLVDLWRFDADDCLLHALPIFHIHGLFVALHCALLSACRVQFIPAFEPVAVRRALAKGTSVMMGVPTFYTRLLEQADFGSSEVAGVRLFISGSAPMTQQVHQQWRERTGHSILERYGMTEAGMIASNPYDGDRMPGTVGFALPGVELRIADADGNELPPGETGSIEIRSPGLFRGYWQMPEKTAEDMRPDGFFITGDLGSMDAQGRLSITGRSKDLVISGGYNIYPKEIELLIDQLPGVTESAVIGVPHPDLGEAVVAVVVGKNPPAGQELLERISPELARFKQPRKVVFQDSLPRNSMGKVQKNQLREAYRGLFKA